MTVVPNSAPMMIATPTVMGRTPAETRVTVIESNAPLLCISAVPNQPTKTPVVVSLIRLRRKRRAP